MNQIQYFVKFKAATRFAKCNSGFMHKHDFFIKKEAIKFYNELKRFLSHQKRDKDGYLISMSKEEEDWGLGGSLCL